MCSCKKKQQLKLHDNVNLKLHFNGHLAFQQATRLVLQHFAAVIALQMGMPEKTAKDHDHQTEEHKPGAKNIKGKEHQEPG